jgi:REP element-mobilizing transposase RayT
VHVTLRAVAGAPNLREMRVFVALEAALRSVAIRVERARMDFRVVAFSVQHDHIHLLVEAIGRDALARGVQGLAVRLARAVNRAVRRRGKLWAGRHHRRALKSPRDVRNALVYVLQNFKKHDDAAPATRVAMDPLSSAIWFDGWSARADAIMLDVMSPVALDVGPTVARPRTWLAREGWKRHGEIDPAESPRAR